jgi:hypothetical protein
MLITVGDMVLLGVFVGLGVWKRRRPEAHRAMMLLGTMAAIPAAVNRIGVSNKVYVGTAWETVFGPFLWTVALGLVFVFVLYGMTRKWDRWYIVGYVALTVSFVAIYQVAQTEAWRGVAGWLLG